MLSKEEIEKAKKEGYEIIGNFKSATTEFTKDIFPKKAEAIETLLQYIDQLEKENNKKNKIIDEMVDCIWNYDICDYEIADYTYRKCEYIADDEEKPCKECIKQYFERKVEEDNG